MSKEVGAGGRFDIFLDSAQGLVLNFLKFWSHFGSKSFLQVS